MDHVTVSFKSENSFMKAREKLKRYAFEAKLEGVDLWTEPRLVNCCKSCGLNRTNERCKCSSTKSAAPIISAEEHLCGPDPSRGPPSVWNPWSSQDHAEAQSTQKERLLHPPPDEIFVDVEDKASNPGIGASAFSSNPSNPNIDHSSKNSLLTSQKVDNPKPFFETLKDRGLEIIDIADSVLKPVKKALEGSNSGWKTTGKSHYSEKILGNTDLYGKNMGISYDKNRKFRRAVKWSLPFENLARESSKLISSANDKNQINMFIVNRYDTDEQMGSPHRDIEPQCSPKSTLIIPFGPREFHLMSSKDPADPGHQSTTLTLDTGQMLYIPESLNTSDDHIFHAKGKGLGGGQHFTVVGKTYVSPKKSH